MITEPTYEAVIEDARTGEIVPVGDIPRPAATNTLATTLDLTKVGTLVLDDKAEGVFGEPVKDEDVKIRPDGLVYLPWTWYAERLNRALGRLQWGLVPQAGPQTKDIGNNTLLVVWGHWFVVRGIPVGFEIGEMSYKSNNQKMSFGDAAAGAKSNALARNCKMLGMSLELWDGDWVNSWRKKWAETYEDNGRTLWRKKSQFRREHPVPKAAEGDAPAAPADAAVVTDASVTAEPETEAEEKQYTVKMLSDFGVVKNVADLSGKPKSEVVKLIGSFEKNSKHTIKQVVDILTGEDHVA